MVCRRDARRRRLFDLRLLPPVTRFRFTHVIIRRLRYVLIIYAAFCRRHYYLMIIADRAMILIAPADVAVYIIFTILLFMLRASPLMLLLICR